MARLKPHPLMAAIVDNPDADLPRLVYADWLDEQGDPKLSMLAEYIRLGVEWNGVEKWGAERREGVRERLLELETKHRETLLPPTPKWARGNLRCQRGLPHHLDCTFRQFALGGRILEVAPITSVMLRSQPIDSTGTFARQELVRVRELYLLGTLFDDTLEGLMVSPYLGNLRELMLQWFALTDQGAEAFARSASRFGNLTKLRVYADAITPRTRASLLRGFGERLWINDQREVDAL